MPDQFENAARVDAVSGRAKNRGFNVMRWCAHAQSEMKAIMSPKKRCSVDAENFIRFRTESAFSNLSEHSLHET